MRGLRTAVVAATALLLTTACSSGDGGEVGTGHAGDAVVVATSFHDLVASGEPASACSLLSPAARTELEDAADKPCPEALAEQDLQAPGDVRDASQFGSMAQVRYDGDVVFLNRFPGGWRVVAAGCRAPVATSGVYDCAVKGV